jgi:hypothetical protein
MRAVVSASERISSKARVCLAIDAKVLASAGARLPTSNAVSFLLDDVSEETPVGLLVRDDIEAIRFRDSFVEAAAKSLRFESALKALLVLAGDLALPTFGAPFDRLVMKPPHFDFVPAESGGRQPGPAIERPLERSQPFSQRMRS